MVELKIITRFHDEDRQLRKVMGILDHAWAPEVISRLGYYGRMRYNQIKGSLQNASSTSLSRILSMLEENGLVSREVKDTSPPAVAYSLTDRGKEIWTLVSAIRETGAKWEEREGKEIVVPCPGKE